MDNPIQNRLNEYLKYKSLTNKDFEDMCGLSNGAAAKLSEKSRKTTFNRLVERTDLNVDWLLTGEGEMLKEFSGVGSEDSTDSLGVIPFYDAETTGGFMGQVSSSDAESTLIGYIQAGGWFAGRETAAIRHVGRSMLEYPDGCILAVREVLERHLLVPGKNYVIETSEYRVTKRMQRGSKPGTISLYSTNQEKYDDGRLMYEPFEIEVSDIRRIFSILGYIVNQSGDFRLVKV